MKFDAVCCYQISLVRKKTKNRHACADDNDSFDFDKTFTMARSFILFLNLNIPSLVLRLTLTQKLEGTFRTAI